MEIPIFNGEEDAYWWLINVAQNLEEHGIRDTQRLPEAVRGLAGKALHWFRWWDQRHPKATWLTFQLALIKRFKPEFRPYLLDLDGEEEAEFFEPEEKKILELEVTRGKEMTMATGNQEPPILGIFVQETAKSFDSVFENFELETSEDFLRIDQEMQKADPRTEEVATEEKTHSQDRAIVMLTQGRSATVRERPWFSRRPVNSSLPGAKEIWVVVRNLAQSPPPPKPPDMGSFTEVTRRGHLNSDVVWDGRCEGGGFVGGQNDGGLRTGTVRFCEGGGHVNWSDSGWPIHGGCDYSQLRERESDRVGVRAELHFSKNGPSPPQYHERKEWNLEKRKTGFSGLWAQD